jgi:hypothetical protein
MKPSPTVPLVFALAVAASAADASTVVPQAQSGLMTPGSLERLLVEAQGAGPGAIARHGTRFSQWFNNTWFNCYSGNWRRC